MAPPLIESVLTSFENSDVTLHGVALPATIVADRLIGILFGCQGDSAVTPPSGFIQKGTTLIQGTLIELAVFVKKAVGTEGGSEVTVDTVDGDRSAHIAFVVKDWSGDINNIEISVGAIGISSNPDPDSVTAPWGSADNLFITITAIRRSPTISAYPTDYTGSNTSESSGGTTTADCGIAMGTRALAAASDDPGTFTVSASRDYAATTLVIKPATSGPTITDIDPDPAETGAELTITGTAFDTEGVVTQEQGAVSVTLSQTSYADTEAVVDSATIESTQLKYGTQTGKVAPTSGGSSTKTFVANPASGSDYIDLTSINATAEFRITAIPDLAATDQLRNDSVTTPGGFAVTMLDDASFEITAPPSTNSEESFGVRAKKDGAFSWGTAANQSVTLGTPAASTVVTGRLLKTGLAIGIGI